ncbi:transposase, partial [Bradyrhizobium sp. 143]|uniref:transposase n=1 Tax=Bradyrhizobium sp. 143 TaxID=2782619 RepID=UPI001FFAAC77
GICHRFTSTDQLMPGCIAGEPRDGEVGASCRLHLVRDRDQAYGAIFVRRVRSIGIRDRPTSFRSPWQNAYAERLIGSIRRECIDHVVVFGERHLRHVLLSYQDYYNDTRTHLSLNKDAPVPRGVEWAGNVVCRPILGGLHHQYGRM